ncbi:MAG: hypothetical protein M1822_000621 [Bathelium mastoideum]|nr:MAG: hypothetical protein M1822_000621 [Bathelium mastoideum]
MAIGKGVGGYVFNSRALSADAIHSLTDLVSDVMTLATVSLSLRPPNERFPTGFGKFESLGSVGVSGLLLGGGIMMGWAALVALAQQFSPETVEMLAHWGLLGHHHGHSHSHTDLGPNINAAWLAGGSIIIKEWLYRATLKVAKERKSSVLASNAVHHRIDSLTAFVALIMIGGSHFLQNALWLDPIGGLVISLMVIQAGWGNTRSAILELADVGIDDEIKNKVRKNVLRSIDESEFASTGVEIRGIQGVKSGQNYIVDIELAVPKEWALERLQTVENLVRVRIGNKVRGVRRVKVRFVPSEASDLDFDSEFIGASATPRSSPEPEEETNGHAHDHGHNGGAPHAHTDSHPNGEFSKRK